MAKVAVKNLTSFNQTLRSYDGSEITLPPRFSGMVDSKFVDWVTPDPKTVRVAKKEA